MRLRGLDVVAVDEGVAATSILELNLVEVAVVHIRHCTTHWLASFGRKFADTPSVALVPARVGAVLGLLPPTTLLLPETSDPDELAEAVSRQRELGSTASVTAVGLEDVFNLLTMTGSDAVLEVVRGRSRGRIFMQRGDVVHAVRENRTGLEVAYEILDWPEPQVMIQALRGHDPSESSMRMSASLLLQEAAIRNDELRRARDLPEVQHVFSRLTSASGVTASALIHADREEIVAVSGTAAASLRSTLLKCGSEAMRSWAVHGPIDFEPGGRGMVQWQGNRINLVAPVDHQLALSVAVDGDTNISSLRASLIDSASLLASFTARRTTSAPRMSIVAQTS
jgi:hypothetical protein